jgi:hypothetical protein
MRTAYLLIIVCVIDLFVFGFLGQIRPSMLMDAVSLIGLLGLLISLIMKGSVLEKTHFGFDDVKGSVLEK